MQSGPDLDLGALDAVHGTTVEPGRYAVVDDSATPRLATEVAHGARPATTCPTRRSTTARTLTGARLDILGNPKPGSAIDEGFQYLEMRDGVLLSANVRFPDEAIYGPGALADGRRVLGLQPVEPGVARRPGSASPAPSATPPCR